MNRGAVNGYSVNQGSLTVVGTGLSAAGHTTPEAYAYLEDADKVFFVVADPVSRMWIEGVNGEAESLADAYAEGKVRDDSYREMVERILDPVRSGLKVCAAFYGHPGVFVTPSHAAVRQARSEGFPARMLPAVSAADCLYADLGVDPGASGCQSYEASDFLLRRRQVETASALILWQIGAVGVYDFRRRALWSRDGLRLLAERLAEIYPPDHPVTVYEAAMAPICEPSIQRLPLAELGQAEVTVGSTLYVPPARQAVVDSEMAARLAAAEPL